MPNKRKLEETEEEHIVNTRQKFVDTIDNKDQPLWWKHPYLKVGTHPQKGRFVYTTKDIKSRETILRESPIVTGDGNNAAVKVRNLPDVHILYPGNVNPKDVDGRITLNTAAQILEYNRFAIGRKTESSGLFPHTSFLNHSCKPNVNFQILGRGSSMILSAITDIYEGDELCISYGGLEILIDTKQGRKKELKTWFPACACSICILDASFSTRKKMKTLLDPLIDVTKHVEGNFQSWDGPFV